MEQLITKHTLELIPAGLALAMALVIAVSSGGQLSFKIFKVLYFALIISLLMTLLL